MTDNKTLDEELRIAANSLRAYGEWIWVAMIIERAADALRGGTITPEIMAWAEQVHAEDDAELAAESAWRPISEAPRDGTEILISDGKRVWVGPWNSNGTFPLNHYWQSLPAPPQTSTEGG